MLSIKNNMSAMNTNRRLKISNNKKGKIMEKLSSGYRINRAADDAAGLAISEKMRRQIRGLMQATNNAQDGVSYVQVADGAMEEIHSILQRMNELALQSLNGTYTDSDRFALNAEFDQLRAEINRISKDTEFNEQPIFEEHEASYYQIAGNIRWNDNQLHTISATANELNIHLPDNYEPKDYTLSVPAGVYTTQELIDEIDDALGRMSPPNPGFVFEYTDDGFCKLNFESASGMPTEITSIDGSLAYLLFECYDSSSSGNLLGTSAFMPDFPFVIRSGENDTLGFYVEGKTGSNYIQIKVPAGAYQTRSDLIKTINSQLAKNPSASGVVAQEYGDLYIQITGGSSATITGLKGNMFKLETASPYYTSVFYDNIVYGKSTEGSHAYITGESYYLNGITAKINISDNNNTLCFKLNDDTEYTEIVFNNGEYTLSDIADTINNIYNKSGLIASISGSSLKLSSTISGTKSSLVFDTTTKDVYANTYNSLFLNTGYLPRFSSSQLASFTGTKNLSGEITLSANDYLIINVDGKSQTIKDIAGRYQNLNELIDKLNDTVQGISDIKDKITFTASGNRLSIRANSNDVQSIEFATENKNDTYKNLFVGTTTTVNNGHVSVQSGHVENIQGTSQNKITKASLSVTIPEAMRQTYINISNDSNKIAFSIPGSGTATITLTPSNKYTIDSLITEIKRQLQSSSNTALNNMEVEYDNGTLTFKATPPVEALGSSWYIDLLGYDSLNDNYAWKAILGTTTSDNEPSGIETKDATLTTYYSIPEDTTVDNNNNTLILSIGDNDGNTTTTTIDIQAGTYSSVKDLTDAVKAAIANSDLYDTVTVDVVENGKIQFSANCKSISASGSFYNDILTCLKTETSVKYYLENGSYPDTNYTSARIVGRKDLTEEPIEIIANGNDVFTFDFTYSSTTTSASSYSKQINVKIPEGVYSGEELADVLTQKIQEKFDAEGLNDFDIKVSLGDDSFKTEVAGVDNDTVLHIVVNRKPDAEPSAGQYVLDGVRGSAASFIFYKTTTEPKSTYITGTKNISGGITFKPGQNVLTISVDSTPYKFTFPENVNFTADEFADLLNDMFTNGDDNGNTAPLTAAIENGVLKLTHNAFGTHSIVVDGGSARSILFLEESGRNSRDPLLILVGPETNDIIEIPRTRVNSCSLGINSITISKPKYAEKAVNRIKEAITLLSSKRSTYGSIQNRLEHTINNNNNVIENTQASESAIRDADIADEVVEHSINNIILQAAHSMLAQANQQPNLILSLLQ